MAFLDFAALKESVRIEQAIDWLGLEMKERNNQFRGPCPVCKSGGPRSLVITPAKQAFYCFGERTGGDVIALVAHIHQCSMKDAAAFLAGEGSGRSSTSVSSTVPQERTKEDARSLQPLSYLVPDHPKIKGLGLTKETCEAFGAGYAPKGIMRGKFAFPIHDADGNLIAYGGVPLEGDRSDISFPKDFDPEPVVFNFQNRTDKHLFLCRSPMEVLMASQNGIEDAISFLTETVSAGQLALLADLLAGEVGGSIELP